MFVEHLPILIHYLCMLLNAPFAHSPLPPFIHVNIQMECCENGCGACKGFEECIVCLIMYSASLFFSFFLSLSLSLVGVCMSMSKHCLCTQLSELTHKHCNNLHLTVTTIHP